MSIVSSFQFSFATMALAGATVLGTTSALGLAGCAGDEFTVGPSSDGGSGGEGGSSGDGGMGGDGGTSVLGTQYIPNGIRPTLGQELPAKSAFLLWSSPNAVPEGKTIDHFEVCWSTGTVSALGGESECPNGKTTAKNYSVIDPLTAGTQYFWKVRTAFTDQTTSYYSSALPFRTDTSLLAWWRLDEGAGTTAADSSSGANNGTLNGSPAWVTGRSGKALRFNGTNFAFIGDRSSLEGMDALSVETWLKTSTTGATRHIVSKWSAVDRSFALRTGSDGDGRLSFQTFTSGAVVLTSANPFNDDAWHHVIGTYDGISQQLFVDLAMQASGSQTGSIAGSTSEACLGESCSSGAGTGFGFDGTIDEAAIYNRDLTADQRINSYCATLAAGNVDPLPAACLP